MARDLLPSRLAKQTAQHLARRVARELGDEVDDLRELVAGDVRASRGDDLVLGRVVARGFDDDRFDRLPPAFVRHADDGRVATAGSRINAFSISAGYTFSAPLTIMSCTRSDR